MLCPESKKTKVTAGLTRFTCLDIERPDINIVTSLLDDLDICPSQFLEEVGNNLDIEEFDPSDDEGAYSESSDSEGQNTGGLFNSKESQEPRKICSNCRQVCKGCQSDEDLGLPSSFEQEIAWRDQMHWTESFYNHQSETFDSTGDTGLGTMVNSGLMVESHLGT